MTMLSAIHSVKYGPEGFLVNSACPGLCATNLTGGDFRGAQPAAAGAVEPFQLATLRKDGVKATFSNVEGILSCCHSLRRSSARGARGDLRHERGISTKPQWDGGWKELLERQRRTKILSFLAKSPAGRHRASDAILDAGAVGRTG